MASLRPYTSFSSRREVVRHGHYAIFQLAEVAVPRAFFAEILPG